MNLDFREGIIYVIDLVKLIAVFKFLFGFDLNKLKTCDLLGVAMIVFGIGFISLGIDSDNHIFYVLIFQLITISLLFEQKVYLKLELCFLLHFIISLIDTASKGVILLVVSSGGEVIANSNEYINFLAVIIGLFFIMMVCILFKNKRKLIKRVIITFRWYHFIILALTIILSGILSGYAELIIQDMEIVFRLRVALMIASSGLGIMMIILNILIMTLFCQKRELENLNRQNDICIEEQVNQYARMTEKNREIRKFKHDYNAHINAIKTMLDNGELKQLREYLDKLGTIKRSLEYISTNNLVGDGVLNEYFELACKNNIAFSVVGKFSDDIRISNIHLCILLYNAIKNAYEAALKCNDNRSIEIRIACRKKIHLTIKNTVSDMPKIIDNHIESSKNDKVNHGFGIENIMGILEVYDGTIKWETNIPGYISLNLTI